MKNLYVFVGKSGSGKSFVVNHLQKTKGWVLAESYTDRPKRHPDETGHQFISPEEFDVLEETLLFTNFSGSRYAMTKELIDNSDCMILDTYGVKEIKENYFAQRKIIVIGIICDEQTLIEHMKKRGDTDENINKRITHDRNVFPPDEMRKICDVLIYNNKDENQLITEIENFT